MVAYRRRRVQGLDVFYREAGDPAAPTLVLLHGYPSSSFMFRQLIPARTTATRSAPASRPAAPTPSKA